MSSKWRKAKMALGLGLCVHMPATSGDSSPSDRSEASLRPSDAAPAVSPEGEKLSKNSSSRSSKRLCAICLGTMKLAHGHALFTAECSHTFHFQCITSNVKHGSHHCPVCRAKWKEVPFQPPPRSELPPLARDNRISPVSWTQDEGHMIVPRRVPRANSYSRQRHHNAAFHAFEPGVFDDDEQLDPLPEPAEASPGLGCGSETVDCTTFPEFSAVQRSVSQEEFAILVHLKAPLRASIQNGAVGMPSSSPATRAPVDLVTVLDVSGSMAGTKLALLKRAMGFVIHSLGPSDRLAVVAFSSNARRLFPLRRMSEAGKQQALLAVNALVSSGGTNIADGLRKGAKVIEERRESNPVCSIILLSDGQDTYTMTALSSQQSRPDYKALLPSSIRGRTGHHHVPVHAFGFGSDHDSDSMHSISETSGGTFSFIEAESVIQDAFAQCIGGLLSVVVQDLHVELESMHTSVQIGSIGSGSYANEIAEGKRSGSIVVGDLYADEERDFLVYVNVPAASEAAGEDTVLLRARCAYKDSISKDMVYLEAEEVRIRRPEVVIGRSVSVEVDRQRNRLRAAEAMADARTAADRNSLSEAVSILENCRRMLSETPSAQAAGDRLCAALDAELKEMQERMASRQRYEMSGRAYILSGLSSHSWQRATARGDSTDNASLLQSYQTPSMADMVTLSHSMILPPPVPSDRPLRPPRSLSAKPG